MRACKMYVEKPFSLDEKEWSAENDRFHQDEEDPWKWEFLIFTNLNYIFRDDC